MFIQSNYHLYRLSVFVDQLVCTNFDIFQKHAALRIFPIPSANSAWHSERIENIASDIFHIIKYSGQLSPATTNINAAKKESGNLPAFSSFHNFAYLSICRRKAVRWKTLCRRSYPTSFSFHPPALFSKFLTAASFHARRLPAASFHLPTANEAASHINLRTAAPLHG